MLQSNFGIFKLFTQRLSAKKNKRLKSLKDLVKGTIFEPYFVIPSKILRSFCIGKKYDKDLSCFVKSNNTFSCADTKRMTNGKILIDIPDSPTELAEQIYIAKTICEHHKCRGVVYYPLSEYLYSFPCWALSLIQRFSYGARLAGSLPFFENYNIYSKYVFEFGSSTQHYDELWAKISCKQDLISLTYHNVDVGVAVYDTYLRNYSTPTVDLDDPRLQRMFFQAICYTDYWKHVLEEEKFSAIFLGHAVYINWKIIAQLGCAKNIPVYVTYNASRAPVHSVCANRGLQSVDHSGYNKEFSEMEGKEIKLARARELLTTRFSGKVDAATHYMERSSYANPSGIRVEKGAVVIFLHSFFDSPHIYRDMVFEDFYCWVNETLEFLENIGTKTVYLKPHPNRIKGEDAIIESLVDGYSCAKVLPDKISTPDVFDSSPSLVVTVYGTVIAEAAYHGLKVLSCGDNPASSYSFFYQAKTRREYFSFLKNHQAFVLPKDYKYQVESFFFMHNIHGRFDFSKSLFPRAKRVNGVFLDEFRYSQDSDKEAYDSYLKGLNI